jgi:DNA-binding FadR family transcriptional regulator
MDRTVAVTDEARRAETFLRGMIAGGRLPSDGRLPPERELAAELDVPRRAVRRAIERLEADGLVWRRQGKGTFAGQAPDPAGAMAAHLASAADPVAVMEARLVIEPGLAALAAERATRDDVARLRGLADHVSAARGDEDAELWDGALHRLIARIAGNPIMLTTFGFVDEVRLQKGWRAARLRARSPVARALYDEQHRAIVAAIAAADAPGADAAMRAHLAALRDSLLHALADANAEARRA